MNSLVEAGYFRARITSLSDFDKIIGGMAWAIQVFSHDINIPIIYKDTMPLGQKILLTEKIVMVLIAMKCPHSIEPHQIVGLDYANLYPVIRWLIKKSVELRQEQEAFNRLLALRYFYRITKLNRSGWQMTVPIEDLQLKGESSMSPTTRPYNLLDGLEDNSLNGNLRDNPKIFLVKLPEMSTSSIGVDQNMNDSNSTLDSIEALSEREDSCLAVKNKTTQDTSPSSELDLICRDLDRGLNLESNQEPEQTTASSRISDEEREVGPKLDETNKQILEIVEGIDAVPSDLEIVQYQRRYVELHNLLNAKNKDLRKAYILINTLGSAKHYLTKEKNILESIHQNMCRIDCSINNQVDFISQLTEILTTVQNIGKGVENRLKEMRKKRNQAKDLYTNLIRDL